MILSFLMTAKLKNGVNEFRKIEKSCGIVSLHYFSYHYIILKPIFLLSWILYNVNQPLSAFLTNSKYTILYGQFQNCALHMGSSPNIQSGFDRI